MVARVRHCLKTMLCLVLVLGLAPGASELVENVGHLLHDGHLRHSEAHQLASADEGCGDSDEHGCTPLAHHCTCHTSLVGLADEPGPRVEPPRAAVDGSRFGSVSDRGPPSRDIAPQHRPPIA